MILRDIPAEVAGDSERERALLASGMRSWLRVPVWTGDEVRGGLGLFSRAAARYGEEDVEVAVRLADRIGLVLSHQRLAEEARVAAEARERAERLEATVETLTRELESRGRGRIVGVSPSWRDVLLQVGRVAPSETTVLITGESGTGKEIVADLIHQGSPRAGRPLRGGQLRGAARAAARVRAVRPREGGLHRRRRDQDRPPRAGRRAARSSSTRSAR